jgi:hypothetical protein
MKSIARWLFLAAAAISMLLCIATIAVWARGGWIGGNRFKPIVRNWGYLTDGRLGMVQVVVEHGAKPVFGPVLPKTQARSTWFSQQIAAGIQWSAFNYGFAFEHGPSVAFKDFGGRSQGMIIGTRTLIALPYGAVIAMFAVLPMISLVRWGRRASQIPAGICAKCGYDLRATPDRCPECGTVPDSLNFNQRDGRGL